MFRKSVLPIVLLTATTLVAHSAETQIPRTITVTGQGKFATPPDMARIQTGVATVAPTAKEALEENNKAMEKLMATLKQKNIADKDIQTSGFSVYPEYRRNGPRSNEPPKITGYRVNNNVSVRVRNLNRLGEILDSLVKTGSNNLSGVSFSIANPKAAEDQARRNALDDARGRAELYAKAAGVRVGPVISISEQSIQQPRPMMMQARMAMAESSVPIASGEQEVNARINVMYTLID